MSLAPPDAAAIRAARPSKAPHYAWAPLDQRWDTERGIHVRERDVLTVFLAGAECPFTCLFCDLWQHTLGGGTPEGALPRQLEIALERAGRLPARPAIKLYNASNFFDRRAVPPTDLGHLARACRAFERVTVESHPKILGERCEIFASELSGRLEIAMGLETVHPDVFPRLKDGMTLEDFDRAVGWAKRREFGVRAFVLVGLPWVAADAFADWAARSAGHAFQAGADRVSLIPLRTGSGALSNLAESGDLEPVRLEHLEAALDQALEGAAPGIVEADLWDAEAFASCRRCRRTRVERMRRINETQRSAPPISCSCRSN